MDEMKALESLRRRLYARVQRGELWEGTPHLLWTGATDGAGYGLIWDGRAGNNRRVHRIAWELEYGPIPEGLVTDHLCRVHPCLQLPHLEPVTDGENIRRGLVAQWQRDKTHCPRGHPYDEANTYYGRNTRGGISRQCRACGRAHG